MYVLVVEQDKDTADILKETLAILGIKGIFVPKASKAIYLLKNFKFDVVLLDYFTCKTENLCGAIFNFDTPIVLMTSLPGATKDFKDNPNLVKTIYKPFSLNDFEDCLIQCV